MALIPFLDNPNRIRFLVEDHILPWTNLARLRRFAEGKIGVCVTLNAAALRYNAMQIRLQTVPATLVVVDNALPDDVFEVAVGGDRISIKSGPDGSVHITGKGPA